MSGSEKNPPYQYDDLCEQLWENFGLRLGPGSAEVAGAVQTRLIRLELKSAEQYRALIGGSSGSEELFNLAGELVGGRKCFGDRHLLAICDRYLDSLLRSRVVNRPSGSKPSLRIWSIGCGDGSELYTILMEVGKRTEPAAWDLRALGTDLSDEALGRAEKGVYSTLELSGVEQESLEQHFVAQAGRDDPGMDSWAIAPQYKSVTDFRRHNVLAAEIPNDVAEKFNVVLCRGLLGYLRSSVRAEVLGKLAKSLSPDGLLIVAPGEAAGLQHPLLDVIGEEFESVLRPRPPVSRIRSDECLQILSDPSTAALRKRLRRVFLPDSFKTTVKERQAPAAIDEADTADELVRRARRLADDFQFPQALLACWRAMQEDPSNVEAHYLGGVLARRLDRLDEAIKVLERACYLDKTLVMAHFLLGHVYQEAGKSALSKHHYEGALAALREENAGDAVPFAEDMSVPMVRELCEAGLEGLAVPVVGVRS